MIDQLKILVELAKSYANSQMARLPDGTPLTYGDFYTDKLIELLLEEVETFCGHDAAGIYALRLHLGVVK